MSHSKRGIDLDVFCLQNDAVISSAEPTKDGSAAPTILIVDDDRSVVETFSRLLKLEGFQVAVAMSAEAGLELADSVHPNAIILDMRMPITNGLQFLRLLRAKPLLADLPVAIVTGDVFLPESVERELGLLGASVHFKPMWIEELLQIAKTMVAA